MDEANQLLIYKPDCDLEQYLREAEAEAEAERPARLPARRRAVKRQLWTAEVPQLSGQLQEQPKTAYYFSELLQTLPARAG